MAFQEAIGVQRGHATGAGRGDGLPVDMIGDVAGRKDPGDAGGGGIAFGTAVHLDVAVVHRQLA